MKTLSYKNYTGSVDFDEVDNLLFGTVLGIRSTIMYEGKTIKELKKDFMEAVDQYLKSCKEDGIEPEVPFKGSFNVRIDPELHKQATIKAKQENISLNKLIEKAVYSYVH